MFQLQQRFRSARHGAGVSAVVAGLAIAVTGLLPRSAWAFTGSWLPEGVSLGGFVRVETAIKTNGKTNEFNQSGNPFDAGGMPNDQLPGGVQPARGVVGGTQILRHEKPTFNLHILRAELAGNWRITDSLQLRGRLIGIVDPGDYTNFSWAPFNLQAGDPHLLGGRPNLFQYGTTSDGKHFYHHNLPLEWDFPRGQIYFPSLFLQYAAGPFVIRFGEQQIAWGNALFFRVFDTANGLDLRRHSLFDYAQEEYQDKRVSAPALRVTWQGSYAEA